MNLANPDPKTMNQESRKKGIGLALNTSFLRSCFLNSFSFYA